MFCPACHGDFPVNRKVCPTDGATLLKSSQIGKYRVTSQIGEGGMGAVFRALNPDTNGEVALKVMHDDAARSEAMRARFKREAAAVAKLTTSHVAKVFDFGAESDGTLYLVMELLEGHALRQEIHPPPDTMALARVQFVVDGMLKGLSAAHKAGIIHRDLKPENVLLANTDDGEVPRIIDFGIARIDSPDGVVRSGGITKPGTVMGTLVYMAPEQLEGTVSQVGKWSDVYAVGAMIYEMLAGKTQLQDGTHVELVIQHRRGKLATLAELRPDLPAELCAVVQRCLDVVPANRPQDADELRAALAEVWTPGHPSRAPTPAPARLRELEGATAPTEAGTTIPDRPEAVPAFAPTMLSEPISAVPDGGPTVQEARSAPRWIVLAVIAAVIAAIAVVAVAS